MATTAVQERTPTLLEQAIYNRTFQEQLTKVLGDKTAMESFLVEVFNQARRIPDLQRCTITSVRFNLLRVAQLRLNPALPNEVFFIPRNQKQAEKDERGKDVYAMELTIQYGYGGLRKLIMRSPEVRDCFSEPVHANDLWRPPVSPVALPVHQLPGAFQPRGPVIGYYTAIEMRNGNWRVTMMSLAEVESHADRYAKGPNNSFGPAWQKGKRPDLKDGLCTFDKMALKTVSRMACNGRDVPLTDEVHAALALEALETQQPTAAEYQGYDREGNRMVRPALTMGAGTTIDELFGGDQKEAVAVHIERETRGSTGVKRAEDPGLHLRDRQVLEAHRENATLSAPLRAQIAHALDGPLPLTQEDGFRLAGAVKECLDEAQREAEDPPMDAATFRAEVETLWREGGLTAEGITAKWAYEDKRFRGPLGAHAYAGFLSEQHQWLAKQRALQDRKAEAEGRGEDVSAFDLVGEEQEETLPF